MPRWYVKLTLDVQKQLDFLLQSQYWPVKKLQELQKDKLDRLISHAYKTVPYYRNVFDERGIKPKNIQDFSDLKNIPILKKSVLRSSLKKLISTQCNLDELYLNSTGGSTGVPVKIYQDPNYISWATADRIRSWKYFPGFIIEVDRVVKIVFQNM